MLNRVWRSWLHLRFSLGIPVAVAVWVAVCVFVRALAAGLVAVGVGATKGPETTGKKTSGLSGFSFTTVYAMPLLYTAIVPSRSVR